MKNSKKWLLIGIASVLILTAAGVLFFMRHQPIWYVEEDFFNDWGRILRTSSPPFRRFELYTAGMDIPPRRYGYIISPVPPGFERPESGLPVRVYRELSRTRQWQTADGRTAQALALDPWMVFRKHQDPEPDRERVVSTGGGEGILLVPGRDEGAVRAWLTQLLQEPPGTFPEDRAVWDEARRAFFEGRRFQQGAETYGWQDLWTILERRDQVWLYAPLSRVRKLSPYRMGVLDATRFPEKEDWNVYGIQAEVLWALPFGDEKDLEKLDRRSREWLRSVRVQTIIANTIDWIPAHPQGTPYNTVSYESQVAWINSSFIWQGAAYERREIE